MSYLQKEDQGSRHHSNNSMSYSSVPAAMSSHSSASLASSVAGDSNYESFGISSNTFGTLKKIFDSVYRCDSAAVVDSAYNCGSVANQALYQGVEVIYSTTTTATAGTCSGSTSDSNANNLSSSPLQESWKSSVATKPLVVYQCFCDDDDFIDNEISSLSSPHSSSADGRNPSSSSQVENCDDDDTRNSAATEEEETKKKRSNVHPPKPAALKTHTKAFYSKIYSPTHRAITRLYDLKTPKTTTPNNNSKYTTTKSIIDNVSSSFSCLQESLSGSNHDHDHDQNNNDINIKVTTTTASSSATTVTEQPLLHTQIKGVSQITA